MTSQRPAGEQEKRVLVAVVEQRPPLAPPKQGFGHVLRTARALALIVLAVALLGAAPAALSGAYFGLWHLPFIPSASPVPTLNRNDLAFPRPAWVAVTVTVHAQPGTGATTATLEPGYPVTLLAQRSVSNTAWVQVKWTGPTSASGGQGWSSASAFTSYGAGATPIGDLGAFSPSLASGVAAQGTHFAAALYFPRAGYLYQSNATQSFALGDGLRGPLLVATLAHAEAATTPTSVPLSQLVQLAAGDATTCTAAYTQLGGSAAMATFFSSNGVPSVQLAATDWAGAHATTTSMLIFYESLREGRMLSASDRVLATGLLQSSDSAIITAIGGSSPLAGHGPLYVSVKQQTSGWTLSAVGVATVPGGEDYTIAIVASDLATQAAAEQTLAAFLQQLAPLVAHA